MMLRKLVGFVILAPLALALVALAVANRQTVAISLDPFSARDPAYVVQTPLFLLVLLLVIIGILLGGVAAWLKQGRWRRGARRLQGQLYRAQAEIDILKRRLGDAAGGEAAHGDRSSGGAAANDRPRDARPPPQWPPPRALPPAA